MMIYAIVISVIAFGLAVFGFVDRVKIESDIDALKRILVGIDSRAKAEIKVLRADALKEAHELKSAFEARLASLEGQAQAVEGRVKAEVKKAKTAIKKRV